MIIKKGEGLLADKIKTRRSGMPKLSTRHGAAVRAVVLEGGAAD
jgi:hypothetical protein